MPDIKELHKQAKIFLREQFESCELKLAHPCIQRFYRNGWVTQGFVRFHVSKMQGWEYEEDAQKSSTLVKQSVANLTKISYKKNVSKKGN